MLGNFLNHIDTLARPTRYRVEMTTPIALREAQGKSIADEVSGLSINDPFSASAKKLFNVARRVVSSTEKSQEAILFNCESASIPGRQFQMYESRHSTGSSIRMPYDNMYVPITLIFYIDDKYNERKYFNSWMEVINNPASQTMEYYDRYISDMRIFYLDSRMIPTYGVHIFGAYPVNISEVALSYQPSTELSKLSVSFTYQRWEEIVPSSLPTEILDIFL